MLFTQISYIGIDVSGRKLTYAAFNHEPRLLALMHAELETALIFLGGQPQAIIAINAPPRPNCGLMKREELRERLRVPPKPGQYTDLRLADYLLQTAHIHVPAVPESEEKAPAWMRRGFDFYKRLDKMGVRQYPTEGASYQCLEVNSQAAFTVLLGRIPLQRHTLEGRLQRQLWLSEEGLGVEDPMNYFEEITRHKLLHGILPLERVYTSSQLDALMAAYAAWQAGTHPEATSWLGDPIEGRLFLPVKELKESY